MILSHRLHIQKRHSHSHLNGICVTHFMHDERSGLRKRKKKKKKLNTYRIHTLHTQTSQTLKEKLNGLERNAVSCVGFQIVSSVLYALWKASLLKCSKKKTKKKNHKHNKEKTAITTTTKLVPRLSPPLETYIFIWKTVYSLSSLKEKRTLSAFQPKHFSN